MPSKGQLALQVLDDLVMKSIKGKTAAQDVFPSGFGDIPNDAMERMKSVEREARVPTRSIVSMQPDLDTETVLSYMMSNRTRDPSTRKYPEVVKWGDKYYIMDGHHRVAGQLALDRPDVQVQMIGEIPMKKRAGGEVHMQAGGVLPRVRSAVKNVASNQGLNVLLGEDNPMWYGTGIGSMAALYHAPLNEDEIEYDRQRRLEAEMDKAGIYRKLGEVNPVWKNPLPQYNPQELIANYPNWADIPPVQKARLLKNYEDYKRIAPSGHKYQEGGGVKKQAVNLARRGLMGLRGAAPVEHLPTVQVPVTKSALDTPVSRRSVLQSAVGQAARHALPAGELAALGKAVSPVAHVAEVAQAVSKPIGAESIAALMSKAIEMGLNEEQAAKFVKAHVPNAEEHAWLGDLHHTLSNPENYEVDNEILHPGEIMRNWIGIGSKGSPDATSLMGIRPQIRAMKREAPAHYGMLTNYARDIADSSVEDAFERGIIRNERELEMFKTGDPKFWELVYDRD